MLDPSFKFNKMQSNSMRGNGATNDTERPIGLRLVRHNACSSEKDAGVKTLEKPSVVSDNSYYRSGSDERRSLPNNFFLKRLNVLYWKRVVRYVYVRFLRMRSNPQAIARGVAAGAFAGSFPLLGMQTIIGVAIASCTRGNKVVAAASTWISNPFTYVPLFALNFHIGRRLLRLPQMDLPASNVGIEAWMSMGVDVMSALALGSFIMGIIFSLLGYYIGLNVAQRMRKAKVAQRVRKAKANKRNRP